MSPSAPATFARPQRLWLSLTSAQGFACAHHMVNLSLLAHKNGHRLSTTCPLKEPSAQEADAQHHDAHNHEAHRDFQHHLTDEGSTGPVTQNSLEQSKVLIVHH
jgi:hypothetical protein